MNNAVNHREFISQLNDNQLLMNNCVEPSKSRIMEIVTKVKTELIIENMKTMRRYKMIIRKEKRILRGSHLLEPVRPCAASYKKYTMRC
jgi:hypothetical protein